MKRKPFHFLSGRLFYFIALIALQGVFLFLLVSEVAFITPIFCGITALGIVVVFWLMNRYENPSYQISWVLIIILLPVFGLLMYLLFGNKAAGRPILKRVRANTYQGQSFPFEDCTAALAALEQADASAARQAGYLVKTTGAALHQNTHTEFFCPGEKFFHRFADELQKAEKYIFLEFFTIADGYMWKTVLDILYDKARSGVDVRIIYDDAGCVKTLPAKYPRYLESLGIRCVVFNRMTPVLSIRHNNRDHRKICVIDGKVGFTGGINLADEYINMKERFGHWVDSAVMLRGSAVRNLTSTFLATWGYLRGEREDVAAYFPPVEEGNAPGFALPYTDNPFLRDDVAANAYLNMIRKARRYLYINTPYLILDFTMQQALIAAAQSGLDLRVCFPGIPDKPLVYLLGWHGFKPLVEAGVKIYIYEPGFIHSKTFVADDETAIVGTVNMDFRSLYLHFENAVWMYKTGAVEQVKRDFLDRLAMCRLVTEADIRALPWYKKALGSVISPFAPLL